LDVPPDQVRVRVADAAAAPLADPPAYVYAASDNRPRQPREIELCEKANNFDWLYTGTMLAATVGASYIDIGVVKESEEPGIRLIGPGLVGFFWGAFLSGGYLSLPKCEPTWAYGAPPEGNVRVSWPMAAAISLVAVVTAPAIDYIFLGNVPVHWPVIERTERVFLAMGTGLVGSLFPYVVKPRPWAARLEIDKIRVGATNGGAFMSYGFTF
jgi:hypothetical protein